MKRLKRSEMDFSVNINLVVLFVAAYFAFVFNHPVLEKFYELSGYNLPIYLVSHILLFAVFTIIFSLFAWPYLFKLVLIPLIITSALAFYASIKYNVMFDYAMMENIFETNTGEASSYINFSAAIYFIILGIIPTLLLFKVKITYGKSFLKMLSFRIMLLVAMAAVIGIIALFYYKDYASIGRNNSYLKKMINPAHAFNSVKYLDKTYLTTPLEYLKLGEDATIKKADNGKPTLMIFVVGETARAQNIGYNGYHRNTNPYTENMGLITFQNVSSCGTATAVSLPCMFSNMSRTNYKKERAVSQDNALDILSHAGVDVTWIDNDGGDKRVAQNVTYIEIKNNDEKNSEYCSKGSCFDEVMLNHLPSLIKTEPNENKLILLHIIGSHGPTYFRRYPKDKALFSPACERSDIENCTEEEIINVYDNTIAYTDYILAKTIDMLKAYQENYNVAFFYLSDHGESLGENGIYLHGTPYIVAPKEQTHVPWYMWASDEYFSSHNINKSCLKKIAENEAVSQDNLFHTLLGFYGVTTTERDDELDITANCRL